MANTEVGTAYVTIMPSMKGFQKGVENGISSTFGKLKGVIAGRSRPLRSRRSARRLSRRIR